MLTTQSVLAALLAVASAHMEVQYPPPLKSKYNPNTPQADIDYNMVSPLAASGSDFPCKGYQSVLGSPAGAPTASFAAGAKGNMTITGGANHGGGSCQISLSTDGAKTFTVLQSIIGNCPTQGTSNLDFTMPPDAPAGDAVLAWTWHNQIGNREMYMNCAAVTITGGGAKKRDDAAVAFATRPGIYVANVGPAGDGCSTAESFDVVYPDPGPNVLDQSQKPKTPTCGLTQKVGSGGGGAPAPAPAPPSGGSPSSAEPSPPSGAKTTTATTLMTVTTTAGAASPTFNTGAGSGSGSGAGSDAKPSSVSSSSAAAPAATDAGSSGSSSSAPHTPGTACTPEGVYACLPDNASFQRCASGQWSDVQPMAPGTSCSGSTTQTLNMVAVV